ncbi:MAG: substrate-binding domain-containing protein [Bacteroidota bacterium]|nr:substrate-binding domain-containing protein [Bacteroidota bacterium]
MNIWKRCLPFILLVLVELFVTGCGHGEKIPVETPTSGSINISVDESFKPVIDSQLKVFESSFPDVRIRVSYKPEAECLRDLAKDSTRMIIITRGLNPKEESFYKDSLQRPAYSGLLAYDAVALIVNSRSRDTVMSMEEIRNLLTGKDKKNRQPVMDGISKTSIVRYAMDSILDGKSLGQNVVAAKSSPQVIDYVSSHDNAVGFIGVSWIGDQEDSVQLTFLQKVKVVAVECASCAEKPFVQPFQANIVLKRYPMVRGLYYILKENYSGIGNNFVNFLQNERGQLIFRRAYLVPARMTFNVRDVQLK